MSTRTQTLPRRGIRLTGRAGLLAAIVLLLLTATVFPLRRYFDQRAEVSRLEHRIEVLMNERAALERRIERLQDPSYLERLARECLGMVRPGEIAFIAVPENGRVPETPC